MPQTFTISVNETKLVTFTPNDASGNPGGYVPGTASWGTDAGGVATITQSTTNELQATVKGIAPGVANITVTLQTATDGAPGPAISVSFVQNVVGGPVAGGTFSEA